MWEKPLKQESLREVIQTTIGIYLTLLQFLDIKWGRNVRSSNMEIAIKIKREEICGFFFAYLRRQHFSHSLFVHFHIYWAVTNDEIKKIKSHQRNARRNCKYAPVYLKRECVKEEKNQSICKHHLRLLALSRLLLPAFNMPRTSRKMFTNGMFRAQCNVMALFSLNWELCYLARLPFQRIHSLARAHTRWSWKQSCLANVSRSIHDLVVFFLLNSILSSRLTANGRISDFINAHALRWLGVIYD
jgi:hypothetical protein